MPRSSKRFDSFPFACLYGVYDDTMRWVKWTQRPRCLLDLDKLGGPEHIQGHIHTLDYTSHCEDMRCD